MVAASNAQQTADCAEGSEEAQRFAKAVFDVYGGCMLFEGNERREREREMKEAGRLPPGQSLTLKWPVLHYGSVPRFDQVRWDFAYRGW